MFLLTKNRFHTMCNFFQLLYLESGFYPQLTIRQLIQPDLESRFIDRSQLGPSIQSGSSPGARLQVVTQSTDLSKDCYLPLVSNPHRSEIRPPKQLDYRCMSTQSFRQVNAGQVTQADIAYVHLVVLILIVISLLFHAPQHWCEMKKATPRRYFQKI